MNALFGSPTRSPTHSGRVGDRPDGVDEGQGDKEQAVADALALGIYPWGGTESGNSAERDKEADKEAE